MIGARGERSCGQSLVEFSLVSFILFIVVLGLLEISRMVLVYAAVADAARAGVRYAIVHGSDRTAGAGVNNAAGPGANPAQVLTVVKDFLIRASNVPVAPP